jgi:hypothetical protein
MTERKLRPANEPEQFFATELNRQEVEGCEFRALREQLQSLPPSAPPLLDAYRELADLLSSMGKIVGHPTVRRREDARLWFKRFCELTFVRVDVISVEGSRILGLHPQSRYRELLAVSLASLGVNMCGREELPVANGHTATPEAVEALTLGENR